jgi:hypothetical protein
MTSTRPEGLDREMTPPPALRNPARRQRQVTLPLAVATVLAVTTAGLTTQTAAAATNDNNGNPGNGAHSSHGRAPRPHGGPTRQRIHWTLPSDDRGRGAGRPLSGPQDTKNTDEFDGKSNMPGGAGETLREVAATRGEGIANALGTVGNDVKPSAITSTPAEAPNPPVTGQVSSKAVIGAIGASLLAQRAMELGKAGYLRMAGRPPEPSASDVAKANRTATDELTKSLGLSDRQMGLSVEQLRQQQQLRAQQQRQQNYGRAPESAGPQQSSQQPQAKPSAAEEEAAAQANAAAAAQETANLNTQAASLKAAQVEGTQRQQANVAEMQRQNAQAQQLEQTRQAQEVATESRQQALAQQAQTQADNAAAAQRTAAESAARLQAEQEAEAAALARPGARAATGAGKAGEEESRGAAEERERGGSDERERSGAKAPEEEAPAPPVKGTEPMIEDGVPSARTMSPQEIVGLITGGEE